MRKLLDGEIEGNCDIGAHEWLVYLVGNVRDHRHPEIELDKDIESFSVCRFCSAVCFNHRGSLREYE
jgi:hypothetical protein